MCERVYRESQQQNVSITAKMMRGKAYWLGGRKCTKVTFLIIFLLCVCLRACACACVK